MLKSNSKRDVSVGEVARVFYALRAGIDPDKLTREIAARHAENSRAAGHLVDLGLACLWLSEGAPTDDVLTVLECRHRFTFSSTSCRAYAVEIVQAAEHYIQILESHLNTTSKEHDYAAA